MTDVLLTDDAPAYLYDRLRAEATQLLMKTGLVDADQITLAFPKPNIPADLAFPVFRSRKGGGGDEPRAMGANAHTNDSA